MSGPFPAAFYADKDGVVGVIAEDPDGDGRAGVVLRRAAGAWAVSADPKDKNRPLLDAGWFGDESLRANFARFQKHWGKQKAADVFEAITPELTAPAS